jgi:hypothetical protein
MYSALDYSSHFTVSFLWSRLLRLGRQSIVLVFPYLMALARTKKTYRPLLATPDPMFESCMFPVGFLYLTHFSSLALTIPSVVFLVGCYLVLLLSFWSILRQLLISLMMRMKRFAYWSMLRRLLIILWRAILWRVMLRRHNLQLVGTAWGIPSDYTWVESQLLRARLCL